MTLDVGTNRETLLQDPLYLGLRRRRLTDRPTTSSWTSSSRPCSSVFPRALIQFEDFANRNAFRLLEHYRDRVCSFNDDIQGTAAVVLAGLHSALRITGGRLTEQRILVLGAGSAAIGCGGPDRLGMVEEGLTLEQARERFWLFDSRGLVVQPAGRSRPAEATLRPRSRADRRLPRGDRGDRSPPR